MSQVIQSFEEKTIIESEITTSKIPSFQNRAVRKWVYAKFNNPSHKSNLQLSHWIPKNKINCSVYPFSKLDKHADIIDFNKDQYIEFKLSVHDWTYNETQLLMSLCKKYELKFYIIQDQYNEAISQYGVYKERTVEEIKHRFYFIDRILKKNLRMLPDDMLPPAYDLEHEIKRKQLLRNYYSKTTSEISEEIYLMNELKRINNKQKEMEKVRIDTQKLLLYADEIIRTRNEENSLLNNDQDPSNTSLSSGSALKSSQSNATFDNNDNLSHCDINKSNLESTSISNTSRKRMSNSSSLKKKKSKNTISRNQSASTGTNITNQSQKSSVNNHNNSSTNSSISKLGGMGSRTRVVDAFKNPGVHVRGQKMIVTHNIGMKRIKMLEQVCIDLGLDTYPPPTEEIYTMLVELRTLILTLFDLKHALGVALYDRIMLQNTNLPTNTNRDTTSEALLIENESLVLKDSYKSFSNTLDSMVTSAMNCQRKRKASMNKSIQSSLSKHIKVYYQTLCLNNKSGLGIFFV